MLEARASAALSSCLETAWRVKGGKTVLTLVDLKDDGGVAGCSVLGGAEPS